MDALTVYLNIVQISDENNDYYTKHVFSYYSKMFILLQKKTNENNYKSILIKYLSLGLKYLS